MRQFGDSIIDRFMPGASAEEREQARENLRALARAQARIAIRITREKQGTDSPESDSSGRIPRTR